jgi:antitoxin (DNA-binding transcriptional repressor) of toxin-antitoxin stability system
LDAPFFAGRIDWFKVNLKFMLTSMKEMTMLEFRRNARRALDAVRRGERIVLTYRGKAVARLEPIRPEATDVPDDDPLLRIEDFALDGPGAPLPNEAIDRIVYGI